MNVETFKATAAGLILIGGFVFACWTGIKETEKPTRKRAEPFKPITPQPIKQAPEKPKNPRTSPETIEAMHKQADAERAIAEALEHKARYVTDPIKRARIEKQAVNSWLRFNQILDRIDKLTVSE